MEKMVNEIIELFNIESRISRKIWTGYAGIIIPFLFYLVYYIGMMRVMEVAKQTSNGCQEFVSILSLLLSVIVSLLLTYYLIKYAALLIITMIQYGVSFSSKISKESIVSIMTTEVEDMNRMHRAIVKYLKEFSTPKHFAALFIFLNERQLIYNTEQNKFLEFLKADFPQIDAQQESMSIQVNVPSPSSFSEAKKDLEKGDYKQNGFSTLLERKFKPFIRAHENKQGRNSPNYAEL